MTEPQGFDISHYQTALTPQAASSLRSRGYDFAGIKASEGSYQTDPHFAENRASLRTVGFPRWLYHEVTTEPAAVQLPRIMEATGGFLYPRERLALALGDFGAPANLCLDLISRVNAAGPVKRAKDVSGEPPTLHRPPVLLYANRSNFQTVYRDLPGPRVVAAYPGPPVVACVIHQDADHDPATGGDHDVWLGGDLAALMAFFRS